MNTKLGIETVAKRPPRNKDFMPEWLDEDPEEAEARKKRSFDPYGSMIEGLKFRERQEAQDPSETFVEQQSRFEKKQSTQRTLAQFCGQWGMRFEQNTAHLDLHGMRLSEALGVVDRTIQAILDDGRIKKLRIITGRGTHSQEGVGVLAREVHPHVANTYAKVISQIDVSPSELRLGGFPAKGHFDVRFR